MAPPGDAEAEFCGGAGLYVSSTPAEVLKQVPFRNRRDAVLPTSRTFVFAHDAAEHSRVRRPAAQVTDGASATPGQRNLAVLQGYAR